MGFASQEGSKMAEIAIINPRFEVSYWGMEHALPLLGKRANLPVAALPLLAALTPGEHDLSFVKTASSGWKLYRYVDKPQS
jgi:hypothetical protein